MWATQFHPREVGGQRPAHPRQLRRALRQRRNLMDLYPAIDPRDGRCVRLTQGTSSARPCTATTRWAGRGCSRTPARRGSTSSTSTQAAQRRAGEPAGGAGHRRVGEHAGAGRRGRTGRDGTCPPRRRRSRVVIGTAALEWLSSSTASPAGGLAGSRHRRGVRRCPCTGGRRVRASSCSTSCAVRGQRGGRGGGHADRGRRDRHRT